MKLNLLQKLSRRERRVMKGLDKANWSGQSPMIAPPATTCSGNIDLSYEGNPLRTQDTPS